MEDSELAAHVRQLTGKETNTEALAALRSGAPTLREPEIHTDAVVAAPEPATTGTKVDPSKFAE